MTSQSAPTQASKTEHTPGPWELHQGLDYITVMRGDECTDQGIQVDNLGDAHLIAAAPELLQALNTAPELDCWPDMTRDELEKSLQGYVEWFHHVALAAIAKAEGR